MSDQKKKAPINVLVVDDLEANRYLLKSLLTGSGYRVTEAPNGKKALEILAQGTWDLVISDILMPVMDGFQLCKEIRSSPRLSGLPFIFYTATYVDQKDEDFALRLGADRFYRKPTDPRVFLDHIQTLVREVSENRDRPRPVMQEDEKEILKLYSERLVNKLEAKMVSLEREMAERRQVEAALRESEKRYRLIAENTVEVIAILDLSLRFTYISPSILKLRGFSPEEAMSQSLDQVITPESREIVSRILAEEMALEAGGQADPGRSRSAELEEYRKDGSIIWAEISLSFLRDEERKPVAILSVSRDITDRKAAAEKLKQSEKRYRELYDFLPIPVYEMDLEGKLTAANRAIYETFGGSEDDLSKGFRSWQLLSPAEAEKSKSNIQKLLRGEAVGGTEYSLRRLDSSVFPAIVVSSIVSKDGQPAGLRGAIIDITARRQAEEEVRAALREKEILLREIHHRVRNNMQVILSLFNLQARHSLNDEARAILKEAQARIRTMSLVHEKLFQSGNLSQIDFGEYINSLAVHLVHLFRPQPGLVRLETEFDDVKMDVASAIPSGLILNELISNALNHAFPEGRVGVIRIALKRGADGLIEIRVADDGIGFPENLNFREAKSLGLQIVSLLAGQLEATISLNRTIGTAFTVTFRPLEPSSPV
jgi:PAS domain S-box-containing protein